MNPRYIRKRKVANLRQALQDIFEDQYGDLKPKTEVNPEGGQ